MHSSLPRMMPTTNAAAIKTLCDLPGPERTLTKKEQETQNQKTNYNAQLHLIQLTTIKDVFIINYY